jgi:hypothetical protein
VVQSRSTALTNFEPAFGLGIMAVKAAKPTVIRAHSLSSHAAFGAGLYLGILIA